MKENIFTSGTTPCAQNEISGDKAFSSIPPPSLPSQLGPAGNFYDFNEGPRMLSPEGRWRVTLIDDDLSNILFHSGRTAPRAAYSGK